MKQTKTRIKKAFTQFRWMQVLDWWWKEIPETMYVYFKDAIEDNLPPQIPVEAVEKLRDNEIPNQKELNQRDNDLADIFNTSPATETKWDLYMRIIEYLVKKWFLQNEYGKVLPNKNSGKSYNVIDKIMEDVNQMIWMTPKSIRSKELRVILTKHLSSK